MASWALNTDLSPSTQKPAILGHPLPVVPFRSAPVSSVYSAPQACSDTSWLTKWHLGVMMVSDQLSLLPSRPCSRT